MFLAYFHLLNYLLELHYTSIQIYVRISYQTYHFLRKSVEKLAVEIKNQQF